ncbi:DNA helicase [Ktedonobacter sp. SOSP1-85]|uniref:UvrD-helicase domain-containing protein n=1 Tax=Ktedonobacter sp. SOSP1-85 TaxID=2778367 RepID=UPI0019150D6E|nr:UvrD-helicase domain-containing protein [Ktedonobacter sp. SOSP1-85]GHO79957.1 DNA helicase [Ktedonobacter sp. SOSP1-85]
MPTQYLVTMKPEFLTETRKLPAKEAHQIYNKILLLAQDPRPDAKVKKQLTHMSGGRGLHRIRSGNYRIFYTFDQHYVGVLFFDRRDDDTYDSDIIEEYLGGFSVGAEPARESVPQDKKKNYQEVDYIAQPQPEPLPEPITVELLTKLEVPVVYHQRLLRIQDRDALLFNCPGVDDDTKSRIDAYLFETPLADVLQQPDLLLPNVEDLWRYHEGELVTFLLKLSPEQEALVNRSLSAGGPTLVKGGPGTGKSTVALYRVRTLLQKLRSEGVTEPRILFTTYTNALVKSSQQLLEHLLGPDMKYVTVQTADKMILRALAKLGQSRDILESQEAKWLFREAASSPRFEGNALQQQLQRSMLERLGEEYLWQEICDVIESRHHHTLEEYLQARRHGRVIRLNALNRKVIWSIYERFRVLVEATGKDTWQIRRTRAAELVEQSREYQAYDAVIVDEAQDLAPSALRFLVKLCKTPNNIFVAADANQSIYGSGFNWSDVHEWLNFKGRTGHLHTNYRSTREIGEAASSYLQAQSLLDEEYNDHVYVHDGPIPIVCTIESQKDEVAFLARLFRKAVHDLHHPLGSCALLCPGEQSGRALAQGLSEAGVEATYMSSTELDLKRSGVKVLTLQASKGLEFPIVALAGFDGSPYAVVATEGSAEAREEAIAKDRRTIFVGMTRAMKALFVLLPKNAVSPLMEGFHAQHWSLN